MNPRILVTLGPSSLSEEVVTRCAQSDIYVFRLNLSHTPIDAIEDTVRRIQGWTDVPVCLDSEGAQLRCQAMTDGQVRFADGDAVRIHFDAVLGDGSNISFTPVGVVRQLVVGDVVHIDFDSVRLRIDSISGDHAMATVEIGGVVGSNKAADVEREIDLPAITAKDEEAIRIGRRLGLDHFALSFTNSADDVGRMRDLCGPDAHIMAKIESPAGLLNLDDILKVADEILIDRGDLSRRVPIERVPFLQRRIIAQARWVGVPVYVATNLLESMVTTRAPTRAEVNDVVSTLLMGANGLVLAAETAIGDYPVEAVEMIRSLADTVEQWTPNTSIADIVGGESFGG
jgi:pyruvate kinase